MERLSMVSFTGACEQSMLFIDDTVPTLSGAGGLRHGAEEGLRRVSRRGRKSHTLTEPKLQPSQSKALLKFPSCHTFCCHFKVSAHLPQMSRVNNLFKDV